MSLFAVSARKRAVACFSQSRRYLSNSYSNILVTTEGEGKDVALITLNRPKALNALNADLFNELNAALKEIDADNSIGASVITGSKKAFAAGADIKQMQKMNFEDVYTAKFLADWQDVRFIKKPIIAAVSGYALGGGCELAMMCDIILASPTAIFGQPEINLGTIPGGGGSQRLVHAVGKSRAMEMNLTGRNINAKEAADWGLVSRVVGEGENEVVNEALKMASTIASKGRLAVQAAKQATNAAYELALNEGLNFERALFHATFASEDRLEGMTAFSEKRKANWKR